MRDELYFESYPLSLMSISIPLTLITLIIALFGAYLTGLLMFWVYLIMYLISYMLNLKYRTNLCNYYGLHINKGFGKTMSKLIKPSNKGLDEPFVRVITALVSIFTILIPIILALNGIIRGLFTEWVWIALILLALYILGVIIPAFVLKKKIKVCEMPSK